MTAWRAFAVTVVLAASACPPASAEDFESSARAVSVEASAALKGFARPLWRRVSVRAADRKEAPPALKQEASHGTWKTTVGWSSDPMTGEDVLAGHIAFVAGAGASACRALRLVQAARVEVRRGRDLDWTGSQAPRNAMRSPGGFFIDHDAAHCAAGAGCSPYYRDHWPLPEESQDGWIRPGDARAASLADYPFGWTSFERITLESCARCADDGRVLGCVRWGGDWPETGDRSLLPRVVSDAPSEDFMSALAAFDAYYASRVISLAR